MHLEKEAEVAGVAVAGSLRAVEVGAIVLIGLLVCPPLAILTVLVVVPMLVVGLVVGLLAAVLAAPYLLVQHLRGHHGHLTVLTHRLRVAGRSILELAPHRIHQAAR